MEVRSEFKEGGGKAGPGESGQGVLRAGSSSLADGLCLANVESRPGNW